MCQLAHRNYFNPLPPHGGRPYCTYQPAWLSRHFNPLPPHGGRRGEVMYSIKRGTFQSTPSAWRETYRYLAISCSFGNFNPLPPHGGRPVTPSWVRLSIPFQSTPSAWRETVETIKSDIEITISIHSLRMEGDAVYGTTGNHCLYFNPLPPHGGRLSRSPSKLYPKNISIHSLRMEGDGQNAERNAEMTHFNPLPPHGGRRGRLPIREVGAFHFNPLPPHGGRRIIAVSREVQFYFNPLPPHGGRLI